MTHCSTQARLTGALSSLALAIWGAGCSSTHFRKLADKEVARTIAEKTALVPNMDEHFTIDHPTTFALETFPIRKDEQDFFGSNKGIEVGAHVITLEESLEIAVLHSRSYQNRKETVFLTALSLTQSRHTFTPIFSSGSSVIGATAPVDVSREISRLVDGTVVKQTEVASAQQQQLQLHADTGVRILLRSGGQIASDFSVDFSSILTGGLPSISNSRLGARLSQPLLRGAGFKVAREQLTQAERDLLYELRDFARFRKDFSVQIATTYYQVLQNRDRVKNAWIGLQNFRLNVEREESFAKEGQRTQAALGQLQQAQLTTETQWNNAYRNYKQSLDQFKILLGIPVDTNLILADAELEKLAILHPEISVDQAMSIALETRLDLYNIKDQFEDAGRKVGVSKNALLPDLNLVVGATAYNRAGNSPLQLDYERMRWTAGFDTRLPLNRKAERNGYRTSIINYDRAGRNLQLAVDQIKLEIQDGWRTLAQAKQNYEVAEIGVKLSQRRVEEQELLMQLGRGTARDLVDARTDLISSHNQRTTALVEHTVARLQFWRDLGMLFIKPNGQWNELKHANKP
ncbi:MAG: TolC family protein [Pedosphaera sp.]|nr:TolC family protein [Pedosphaera sp.]